jgi:hypothetical protein
MPKYRGRVDCYINPSADSVSATSRGTGEVFVNVVQHLSSSGPDLGIELIAGNYGQGGLGWNFWDQANPIGHRAWACFRFHSASLGKFDMLVFATTGSSVPHGSVRISDSVNSFVKGGGPTGARFNIGFAFSMHPSGSNTTQSDGPWNGTYSLSSASIADPVWKVNPNGKGAFFPRSNGKFGTFSGSRNNMIGIQPNAGFSSNDVPPWRQHIIISEDSFTMAFDVPASTSGFRTFHFGSFSTPAGMYHESPYFMYQPGRNDSGTAIRNFYATPAGGTSFFGITSSDTETSYINEGLGEANVPDLSFGSRAFSYQTLHSNSTIGYNNYINSGTWEALPTFIISNESPFINYLGISNTLKFNYGMTHGMLSNSSSSIAVGRGTTSPTTELKYVLPWSGETIGSGTVRTGRTFSYDT